MARLPEGALMQRAATGLAIAIADLLGSVYAARVLLLVGAGDNGGDALWAGALLARRGAAVEAVLLSPKVARGRARRPAGRRRPDRLRRGGRTGPDVRRGRDRRHRRTARACGPRPRRRWRTSPGCPVVAVDVPSGVDVDTGRLEGAHVRADLTVTFGTHKVAHLVDPAAQACGVVHLVDIGLDLPESPVEALQPVDVAALLPVPGPFDHKYTRGVVGVRAGSQTYPGAAVLCTSGAVSGLAGMVRYVGSAADAVRARHPEIVDAEGRVQAWVVGSGGDADAEQALADALADEVPTVVDADALIHVRPGHAGRRAHPARGRAGADARRRARGGRGRPARLRPPGGRGVRRRGAAQGTAHARRAPRRARARDQQRGALAGGRRRRRRARGHHRVAARRRPRPVRRGLGRVVAARRCRGRGQRWWAVERERRGRRGAGGRAKPARPE